MITLPTGFDASLLVSDIMSLTLPLLNLAILVAVGFLILRLLRQAKP